METRRFAEELLAKIPRAGAAPGRAVAQQYQQHEREAAAFARQNASFALLSDDEDDFDEPPPAPTTARVPKASKKSLRKSKVPLHADTSSILHIRIALTAVHAFLIQLIRLGVCGSHWPAWEIMAQLLSLFDGPQCYGGSEQWIGSRSTADCDGVCSVCRQQR